MILIDTFRTRLECRCVAGRTERGVCLRRRGLVEDHAGRCRVRRDRGTGPVCPTNCAVFGTFTGTEKHGAGAADGRSWGKRHGCAAQDDMTPAELLGILHATAARAPWQQRTHVVWEPRDMGRGGKCRQRHLEGSEGSTFCNVLHLLVLTCLTQVFRQSDSYHWARS